MSAMALAYLGILPRAMIWFFRSYYYLFYLYCLLIIQLNGRNRRQYLSRWSPCLGFFVCPCYNRTHYPTLEKHGAQNIAACKNQDKQRKLSDHWKLKKTLLEKITGDDVKKTKRLTEIQVLIKTFTKKVLKKTKVMKVI